MSQLGTDACVVGGGVNGLVAAITLADAGWDVVLVEGHHLGGAVRSERRRPQTVTDLFSAFYPLAAASPVIGALDLGAHGLHWSHAPVVLAHPPGPDADTAATIHRDPDATAAALEADYPGDGERWVQLLADWQRIRGPLLDALFSPFPPVSAGARLARVLGLADGLRTARLLLLPVARMGRELFGGEHGRLLLTGNALHADIPPSAAGSGLFGWLLSMLAQDVGFPVPRGGSGALVDALASRARAAGVQIYTGTPVERVLVGGGRALGVRLADGRLVRTRRAVIAATDATVLLRDLLGPDVVPARMLADLEHTERDLPTVKVNWTLPQDPPWRARPAGRAGVVHVGTDTAGALEWSSRLEGGQISPLPFLLVGQMSTADPTRSDDGSQSLWAYTHLPRDCTVREVGADAVGLAVEALVAGVHAVLEQHAPGFAEGALDYFVQGPADLQEANPNLLDGAINGGTAQLHQQLVFRPVPGLGRPSMPVRGLYLGSASAHPGGGVHGACGWNAAVTCLGDHGLLGPVRRAVTAAVLDRIYR